MRIKACHKEAVQALQSVKGDCALCVQFIATDDEDQLSDDNYRSVTVCYFPYININHGFTKSIFTFLIHYFYSKSIFAN